jgi:hypothetical protein
MLRLAVSGVGYPSAVVGAGYLGKCAACLLITAAGAETTPIAAV